jgi:hypothetical protein
MCSGGCTGLPPSDKLCCIKSLLLLAVLLVMNAAAADITGTWKGTAETPNGTIERTFVLKQDGEKLTGETISQRTGKSELKDGKVQGDKVSFSIDMNFQGNDVRINYSGTVTGDEIKFRAEAAEGGFGIDYVARRAK